LRSNEIRAHRGKAVVKANLPLSGAADIDAANQPPQRWGGWALMLDDCPESWHPGENRADEERGVLALESVFCVPHPDPGDRLIGRDEILEELDAKVCAGAGPTLLTALQGTGGIGKTQLAVRYCWTRRRHHPDGIVWLNMGNPVRAVDELVNWAEQLGLNATDTSDRAKANALIGRIYGRPDALVVLDNVEDPTMLDRDLPGLINSRPRGLGCKLLITSRQQVPDCQEIRLDFLPAPLDRAVLLREAKRGAPGIEEVQALKDLLSLLGGLPLALVVTGRLLAARPKLTLVTLRDALHKRGAVSVLSERGQIPSDYHAKMGSSFRAILSEIWDALPEKEPDLRRKVLTALALYGENVFVPEDVLPLMLDLPEPDPDGFDPAPLEQALVRLEAAQLVERDQRRGQLRLHPLIQDFAQQQWERGASAHLLHRVARELNGAASILLMPADRLSEVARALEVLSKLDSGSKTARAVADVCRLLRVEAHAMSLTADPISRRAEPAQLAYATALHAQEALKAAAEEAARASGRPHLRLRWTTAKTVRSLRHRLRGHEDLVGDCAISAHAQIGLSASWDGTLIVWDLASGQQRHRLRGHEGQVLGCAISADGGTGLSASYDQTPLVWDLSRGEQRHRLSGHKGEIWGCALSADGRTGLSASADQTLIVWDLATGQVRHRLRGHEHWVLDCSVSADGRIGLSASSDQTLILWDLSAGEKCRRLHGHEGGVMGSAVSADGRTGLSASTDRTLTVWNLPDGQQRHRLRGHEGGVWGCALSADGCTGLSASEDQTLIVWDLTTGQLRQRLRGHEGGLNGCALSADGRTALSASDDQTLIVWDLSASEEQHPLHGHDGQVRGCAVSASGRSGLSASDDRTLIVWDMLTGQQRRRLLRGHTSGVSSCGVSADGGIGVSVSDGGTLIVWDLAAGTERHRLRGHDAQVSGCAVSADGGIGLSVSSDRSMIVWDLAIGRQLHRLRGHERGILGCAIGADGRIGLSASEDQTLIAWDLVTAKARYRLGLGRSNSDCVGSSKRSATAPLARPRAWRLGLCHQRRRKNRSFDFRGSQTNPLGSLDRRNRQPSGPRLDHTRDCAVAVSCCAGWRPQR
jgi:WD40 repeat protein